MVCNLKRKPEITLAGRSRKVSTCELPALARGAFDQSVLLAATLTAERSRIGLGGIAAICKHSSTVLRIITLFMSIPHMRSRYLNAIDYLPIGPSISSFGYLPSYYIFSHPGFSLSKIDSSIANLETSGNVKQPCTCTSVRQALGKPHRPHWLHCGPPRRVVPLTLEYNNCRRRSFSKLHLVYAFTFLYHHVLVN
jgi:hypothetical protein